jgi:hypothetical protein
VLGMLGEKCVCTFISFSKIYMFGWERGYTTSVSKNYEKQQKYAFVVSEFLETQIIPCF